MTYQTPTPESVDSRDRLIRIEERQKHMEEHQGAALRDLKNAVQDLATGAKIELVETRTRLSALEKRVDKIYWLWSVAVFVGTPAMMAISKYVFGKFGL